MHYNSADFNCFGLHRPFATQLFVWQVLIQKRWLWRVSLLFIVSFSYSPVPTDANQLFIEVSFLSQVQLSDFEEVWNHEESECNLAEEDIYEHNVDEIELSSK